MNSSDKERELEIATEILSPIMFFADKDDDNRFYAIIEFNDHIEFCDVDSERFSSYVRCIFVEETGKKTGFNFYSLIRGKKDETRFFGKEVNARYRIACYKGTVIYFLADKKHRCILINSKGWKFIKDKTFLANEAKMIFLKRPGMKEQVVPISGGDLKELLRQFVNMKDNNFILFLIHLVQCFFDSSSHFISIISSSQGTGKSTLTNLMQLLIDPSESLKTLLPSSSDELKNHLTNNTVVAFDNTKKLTDEFSDILCSAVTGTSYTKRELYTNSNVIIRKIKNIIILNGIDIVPNKTDLLERSLLFELEKIPQEKRIPDKVYWNNFEKKRPYILGAIFDTISKAIKIKKTLKLEKTHRMSDAYTDMVAIALAIGISQEEFITIFNENIAKLEETRSEENFFCNTIKDYLEKEYAQRRGKVSVMYDRIKPFSNNESKYFPKSSSHFSRKLNKERNTLIKLGYDFKIEKKKDANYIEFFKV